MKKFSQGVTTICAHSGFLNIVLLLDLSAAFNAIDHSNLFICLQSSIGVTPSV